MSKTAARVWTSSNSKWGVELVGIYPAVRCDETAGAYTFLVEDQANPHKDMASVVVIVNAAAKNEGGVDLITAYQVKTSRPVPAYVLQAITGTVWTGRLDGFEVHAGPDADQELLRNTLLIELAPEVFQDEVKKLLAENDEAAAHLAAKSAATSPAYELTLHQRITTDKTMVDALVAAQRSGRPLDFIKEEVRTEAQLDAGKKSQPLAKRLPEDQRIRGWDVTRGETWVKFTDGHEGIVADWMGRVIRLEGEPHPAQYRQADDVIEWGTKRKYKAYCKGLQQPYHTAKAENAARQMALDVYKHDKDTRRISYLVEVNEQPDDGAVYSYYAVNVGPADNKYVRYVKPLDAEKYEELLELQSKLDTSEQAVAVAARLHMQGQLTQDAYVARIADLAKEYALTEDDLALGREYGIINW